MMTVEEVLQRARSALDQGTLYWLGAGGEDPRAARPTKSLSVAHEWERLTPAQREELAPLAQAMGIDVRDPERRVDACDCSGYVCWVLGLARQDPRDGGWINTDSIWADAKGAHRAFVRIDAARPGALVVYPRDGSPDPFGHVGIVIDADGEGRATQVVHCSAANVKAAPFDAIKITDLRPFERSKKTIYAWCRGVAV